MLAVGAGGGILKEIISQTDKYLVLFKNVCF